MSLLGAKRKPLDTSTGSPMPGMPGTDDDDLDVELVVKKPPPPLGNGTFLMRVSQVRVWTNDDGRKPEITLTVVDPVEKAKADRNEPSNYGTTVSFDYPPTERYDGHHADVVKMIVSLGYPLSTWPENSDGTLRLGPILKRIRDELICDPPHTSPLFNVTVKTKAGKRENKDKMYTNIKKIAKVPAKPKPAGQTPDEIPT